jgi:hypothetical protein
MLAIVVSSDIITIGLLFGAFKVTSLFALAYFIYKIFRAI